MSKSIKSQRPQVVLVNRAIIINRENNILIIKRSDIDTWGFGKWEFPGGKLDQGQDLMNALEREVFEETNLLVTPINRLAYYESYILTEGKYSGLPYIVLIGICKYSDGEVALSNEHSEFKWIGIDEITNYDATIETKKALVALGNIIKKVN